MDLFLTAGLSPLNLVMMTSMLFLISILGIINQRNNIILIMISVELLFLAVNVNFIVFSVYLDDMLGQVFSLFVLTVAASESAISLAVLVVYYRLRNTVHIDSLSLLKG